MQDQIYELVPTSEELAGLKRRLGPNVQRFAVCILGGTVSLVRTSVQVGGTCINSSSLALVELIKTSRTRIERNPHQAIALLFLSSLAIAFMGLFLDVAAHESFGTTIRGAPDNSGKRIETAILSTSQFGSDVDHSPLAQLPDTYNYLIPINKTAPTSTPVPVLTILPRSGGATIAQILGQCEGKTLGGMYIGPGVVGDKMEVVREQGVKQVTADFTTPMGRTRARDQGLREIPDVIVVTQNIVESSQLFAGSMQAELWVWFRHPIERQASIYYYHKSLEPGHPQYDPSFQALSLTDWAQTPLHTPNQNMLALIGQPQNPMVGFSNIDLLVAKNVLRQKAKIGLLSRKDESLRRFLKGKHHAGSSSAHGSRECKEKLLDYAWTTRNHHPVLTERKVAYKVLAQLNSWDLKLYDYAMLLFEQQGGATFRRRDSEDDSEDDDYY